MQRPQLKPLARVVRDDALVLIREPGVQFTLNDSSGQITALVALLDGTRTVPELVSALRADWPDLTLDDVADGVAALDAAGLIEDAATATALTDHEQTRYTSNLAFFSTFAHLGHSRFGYQEALRRSRVVLLGVGGIGSTLLYTLAGLGVGHVLVLDCDTVELKNLSRQFLYTEADVGQPKLERAVARARALNREMAITPVERHVTGPDDIADLLPGIDLVLAVIDQPGEVRDWINAACVAAGVPFIAGGVGVTRGAYWSVSPGTSGCQACLQARQGADRRNALPAPVNRAIGPAAGLVGSLIGLEAVRYLTGFAPPIAAGRMWLADLATGQIDIGYSWERVPDCPVCGRDAARADERAAAAVAVEVR